MTIKQNGRVGQKSNIFTASPPLYSKNINKPENLAAFVKFISFASLSKGNTVLDSAAA